ncbi:MAG: winged helix-turn-helix transcriptional regulator, partial [Metallosphaera sp.]
PPTLNYRFKKLEEEGILKGFVTFINPSYLSQYYGFLAFVNYTDYDSDWIFLKFKCVEWLNVYGILGKSVRDLEDKMEKMSKTLGEPRLKYIPEQEPVDLKPLDINIIEALKESPRASESEISQKIGISSKLVSKRLKILSKKGVFAVYPILDIPRSGLVMFSMFSRDIKKITGTLEQCTIFRITDGKAGINVCLVENMLLTRNYVNSARLHDPDADVMIIYQYQLSSLRLVAD